MPSRDPYQHLQWHPSDDQTSPTVSIVNLLHNAPQALLSTPSGQAPVGSTPATLHERMQGYSVPLYRDRWIDLIEEYALNLRGFGTVQPPAPLIRARESDDVLMRRWKIRIFARLVGDEGEAVRLVMGFCDGNQLQIAEVHTLVYLMLAEPSRPWKLFPHPKALDAVPLDWQSQDLMEHGDYVWEGRVGNVVIFLEPPRYWDGLIHSGPKAPTAPQTGSVITTTSQQSTRHFTPRDLIASRDQHECRLCHWYRYDDLTKKKFAVAHIIPHSQPDGVYDARNILDPDSYISQRQYRSSAAAEIVQSREDTGAAEISQPEFLQKHVIPSTRDHPANLFFACQDCEDQFDDMRISINVFSSTIRKVIGMSPENFSAERMTDWRRSAMLDVVIDLDKSDFSSTISPNKALFAMHLTAFLALRCRVASPVPVVVNFESQTTSKEFSEVVITDPGSGDQTQNEGEAEATETRAAGKDATSKQAAPAHRPTKRGHLGDLSLGEASTLVGSPSANPADVKAPVMKNRIARYKLTDKVLSTVSKERGRLAMWREKVECPVEGEDWEQHC